MFTIIASSIIYPEIILRSSISIASNLITSLNYLISISKNDIELQSLLDIVEDINIMKAFIDEKQEERCYGKVFGKTVGMCISNLNETLLQLEKNINSISEKMQNHKLKWFAKFRSYDIEDEKKLIPILTEQMRYKFELLLKVSGNLDS